MTKTGDTIVFVGPTLTASEVGARLPGAIVVPPVGVGEVLELVRSRRKIARIAIIDGYFERMAAVWHKELLLALERGIGVWGASSMGALRAAELAPFGMRGVGHIYRAYVRGAFGATPRGALGALTADDEVAVAHLPAEYGYRSTSEALVNLRDGIARAPMLSGSTRTALVELARKRFYRERSWGQLITDGLVAKLPSRQLAALAVWPKPDRKAEDARMLLRALAKDRSKPAPIRVPRTWALTQLEHWLDRDA